MSSKRDDATIDGTKSGGGGEFANIPATKLNEIKNAIEQSRLLLFQYFNFQKDFWRSSNPEIFRLLYNRIDLPGSKSQNIENWNIFKALESHSLIRLQQEKCDFAHKTTDGSAFFPKDSSVGVICLSLSSILTKTNAITFKTQLLALIGHEVSHLLGLNETQAQQVENHILHSYEISSMLFEMNSNLVGAFASASQELSFLLHEVRDASTIRFACGNTALSFQVLMQAIYNEAQLNSFGLTALNESKLESFKKIFDSVLLETNYCLHKKDLKDSFEKALSKLPSSIEAIINAIWIPVAKARTTNKFRDFSDQFIENIFLGKLINFSAGKAELKQSEMPINFMAQRRQLSADVRNLLETSQVVAEIPQNFILTKSAKKSWFEVR